MAAALPSPSNSYRFAMPVQDEDRPIVDFGYASYRGRKTSNHTVVYLGVPYAEPPLGPNRFRKPVPLNTARVKTDDLDVIDAGHYPMFSVQGATSE